MSQERFDLIDYRGRPLGKIKSRGAVHRDGDWHRSVHVLALYRRNRIPCVLLQQRSRQKRSYPMKLDVTVSGHLSAGERLRHGVREIEEEIGLKVDFRELIHLGRRVGIMEGEGRRDHELQEVFLLPRKLDPAQLVLHPRELYAVVEFDVRKLCDLLGGTQKAITGTKFLNRGVPPNRARQIRVRCSDVVYATDNYYYRLMALAMRWLKGDREHLVI